MYSISPHPCPTYAPLFPLSPMDQLPIAQYLIVPQTHKPKACKERMQRKNAKKGCKEGKKKKKKACKPCQARGNVRPSKENKNKNWAQSYTKPIAAICLPACPSPLVPDNVSLNLTLSFVRQKVKEKHNTISLRSWSQNQHIWSCMVYSFLPELSLIALLLLPAFSHSPKHEACKEKKWV